MISVWEKFQPHNIECSLLKRVCLLTKRKKKKVMIIKLMLTCQGRDGSLKLKPGENLQGLGKTFKNVFNSFVEV